MTESFPVENSSWVARLDFEGGPLNGELTIVTKEGKTITYLAVPRSLWETAQKAPSVGKFINSSIIGVYSRKGA